nr:unnamed protein product [Digitaria exilis]
MASAPSAFAPAVAASRSFTFSATAYASPLPTLHPAAASSGVRNQQRPSTATFCLQPPSGHGAATRLYIHGRHHISAHITNLKAFVDLFPSPFLNLGLSFRTTQENLRSAFEKFGQVTEVHLVMDRVAKRPRGFAFVSYAGEEEAKNAIEGMHGKYLDGRVIFVEAAKRRPL